MKISVLMATYNGAPFLAEQLDSLFDQSVSGETSILVRDDGSTDDTIEILERYERDGKLTVLHDGSHLGPALGFLKLLNESRPADYYAFSDQDDIWHPEKLEEAVKRLEREDGPAAVFSNARLIGKAGEDLKRTVYRNAPSTDLFTVSVASNVLGCTLVFNEALARLLRNTAQPERIVMHDSYVAETVLSVGGKLIYDPECRMSYRQHGANTVGVRTGFFSKVKDRFYGIFTKAPVSVADQAEEILKLYGDQIADKDADWLRKVASYRDRFSSRISLSFSRKPRFITKNMGFKIRMRIFFGNQ